MRITSKGQVTIPQVIREKYGFMPETDVEFVERDGSITIQRADARKPDRADQFLRRLAREYREGVEVPRSLPVKLRDGVARLFAPYL